MRRRLDAELVRRGLVPSRAKAVEAIHAGLVVVGGAPATSPARMVAADEAVHVQAAAAQYVSRGGHKLAAALDAFGISPAGRHCLDAGASTGGFTDCLLQRGAAHVTALDVGHGQLAWSLQTDDRVLRCDRTNLRTLGAGDLSSPYDLIVVDLSFISLCLVAPNLDALAAPRADLVLLVKPQFEAGRSRVGKGGVVRDPAVHAAVLREVRDGLAAAGLAVVGLVASPIRGADGNVEFLAHVHPVPAIDPADLVTDADIDAQVGHAHGADFQQNGEP